MTDGGGPRDAPAAAGEQLRPERAAKAPGMTALRPAEDHGEAQVSHGHDFGGPFPFEEWGHLRLLDAAQPRDPEKLCACCRGVPPPTEDALRAMREDLMRSRKRLALDLLAIAQFAQPPAPRPLTEAEKAATRARVDALKTHCIYGHPLAGTNLYIEPKWKFRKCLTCEARKDKRRKSLKRRDTLLRLIRDARETRE